MTNTCSATVLAFPSELGFRNPRAEVLDQAQWSDVAHKKSAVPHLTLKERRLRTLLAVAAIAVLILLALPWSGTGGHTLATSGAARGGPLVAGTVYTVQPGDTLWGIAERLVGSGDPRPVVSQLESEARGDTIQPGLQLRLP
jgi:nucleoid-associated protein YgaU